VTLSKGTEEQKAMAQSALDRWWCPCWMMFGPPTSEQYRTPRPNGRSSASPTTNAPEIVDARVPRQFLD